MRLTLGKIGAFRVAAVSAAFAIAGYSGSAHAATDSDSFDVTATVIASCNVTANDLAFGDYDPLAGADDDASATLSVVCTSGTSYTVALDAGQGSGATVATRRMTNGGNLLSYSLYRDAARTNLWGQTSGSNTVSGTGAGTTQSLTVYGRAPAGQIVPPGNYADVITVTVTF